MITDSLLSDLILLASRSPSAHNTQPWSPRIVEETVEVSVVPSRTLPAGDSTFRDVVLALGAWVESFAIGAADRGYAIDLEVLPMISDLDELPITGPADPDSPVLRIAVHPAAESAPTGPAGTGGPVPFTPEDVRQRAVYRGALAGDPGLFADLTDSELPSWLSLREIDPAVIGHLSRLGIAYTASRKDVGEELLHWLRLSPRHPHHDLDGLTAEALLMPDWAARIAAPFTRRARLRNPALAVGVVVGRAVESYHRTKPLPRNGRSVVGNAAAGRHFVLVANARNAGLTHLLGAAEALTSQIGMPEPLVVDAGRALQRLWLQASREGAAVSPHSELIDSPAAHAALRKRLGLGRADVALAVFSAGRPLGAVPRSARLL